MKNCVSCVHADLSPRSHPCRECGIAMLNYEEAKPKPIINTDRSRVEETYNWRDDVMEITRRIVHETDEARLSNIANHFEVDLSEIRAFLEMKQQQQQKPTTRGDRIRAMSDEELAEFFGQQEYRRPTFDDWLPLCYHVMGPRMCHEDGCEKCWLDWLKQEAT